MLPVTAVYFILTLSACSESRDSKQKESSAQSKVKKAAEARPAAKAEEIPTAGTTTTKETTSATAAKSAEPLPTAPAKAKENAQAPDTKTKESTQALAPKPAETPPSAPKKEEVATVKETAAAPLSLKMNIIGQRKEADGSYTEILVSEGSVMRSRDSFQIHLEASRPAYVCVLMYDSQGKAGQIFPDPQAKQSGSIEGGKKLALPSKDLWFWLDDDTGTETIYVLASEKPMTDIGGLLAKMEGGNDAGQQLASRQIKERIAVMQRGVGGITKGTAVTYTLSDGKKIQKVTDVVTGTGSVVRAVSFQHR